MRHFNHGAVLTHLPGSVLPLAQTLHQKLYSKQQTCVPKINTVKCHFNLWVEYRSVPQNCTQQRLPCYWQQSSGSTQCDAVIVAMGSGLLVVCRLPRRSVPSTQCALFVPCWESSCIDSTGTYMPLRRAIEILDYSNVRCL